MIQKRLIDSEVYKNLTPQAKVLITLLQSHWRNHEPVGYGIQEASELIPCDRRTAMKAFRQLQDSGFIRLVDESLFNSRVKSKTRTWRLTWLPFNDKKPTNEWETISISTGVYTPPVKRQRC